MKTRFSAIIALTVILLTASCGKKDMFVLQGTVPEGADTIVVVGIDSRFENVDTTFSRDGQFKWKFRPDTVTTLILVLPDGRCHPVFAEKGVESFMTIPSDTGLFSVSGGYCNDSYQSFYMASQRDTSMQQTAARIDSFISRDPFSEVTPFLIYDQMVRKYHAPESAIEPLIKRMSGNMQDAPYLVSLKSEFSRDFATNSYLDNYSVTDSAGQKRSFIDIGGTANHLLVCVWASWMGNRGIQARDTLRYFLDKYQDRHLNVTDLSIDANPARWKEAIARDTVLWTSYNDPQAWESSIVKRATIRNAPVYVLFTGTKRLLFKSGSLAEIDSQLDKTLPKPRDDNKKK